jgi:hypothetical protein
VVRHSNERECSSDLNMRCSPAASCYRSVSVDSRALLVITLAWLIAREEVLVKFSILHYFSSRLSRGH